MELDQALALALAQYSAIRKRINRGIVAGLSGVPFFGGKDMLQWIGQLYRPNVTALAEAMGITRGGASKGVARLERAGLVARYQLPENRKSVYYRLTEEGEKALSQLKHALSVLGEKEMRYIAQLDSETKQAALQFLTGFTAHLAAFWPLGEKREEGDG